MLKYPSLFLQDSRYVLTLNDLASPVYSSCHLNLWQLYSFETCVRFGHFKTGSRSHIYLNASEIKLPSITF